jgi:hypothetical protein
VSSVWLLEAGKENGDDSGKKVVVGVGRVVTVQGEKESARQLRSISGGIQAGTKTIVQSIFVLCGNNILCIQCRPLPAFFYFLIKNIL